jgi:hypothetical protein
VLSKRYERAIRFADDPQQLKPKWTKHMKTWSVAFADEDLFGRILDRAAQHIDGKELATTPFVSLARREGQVLRHAEVSLCGPIYGSGTGPTARKAANIYTLRIPKAALITPERLVEPNKTNLAVATTSGPATASTSPRPTHSPPSATTRASDGSWVARCSSASTATSGATRPWGPPG